MISTCWHEPHEPGEEELRRFDVLARQTADLLERARAAATLRESEERLRTALSMQTVGVLFWDEDFKLTDVNDAFLRMTRCTQDEALGKSWQELTPSEFHSASENAIAELKARGEITPYEKQYFRCDSSRFWGLFAMRILGRGAVEFVLDVTDRKNAEAALHASEERLRQFGEASQDVLWIRDVKTLQWTYLTPAFETIYGLSREEALSGDNYRSWLDLLVSEDRKRVTEAIDRVRAGEHVAFEYRIRRPVDGAICWLRNTDFPMRGPSGAVEWIGGVGQDVTELKRIEAALRDEEARQRALIEGIPQLVWRAGEGGLWTWSSPQWRAYTGQSDKQSYGWGWLDALHPDDQEAAHDAWRKVKPDGMLQMECRIRQAVSGQYNWFQIRGRPVRDDGRIIEWIGSCTDIDDQMQARAVLKRTGEELEARVAERTAELMAAEASLRQAQKMEAVGQLTAGIAHDFNNMLQGIAGSLELMRRRSEQGRLAEAMRHVENAHETVCRAAALTHRLLAFSCQQTLAPVPVNLDELVVGMTEMIRRTMGPAIRVEARLDGSWPVLCDVSQLENALLNLCVNARDAMPNGGWLTILTGEEQLSAADLAGEADLAAGAYGTISVTDTGTGMPPEVVARVFEPFYTTKPFGQGTGLGLSQVYGFVHQSGGFVRIESTPGQGTTVRLFLPCHTTMDETQDSETAAADVVLLVEDEPGLREMAAEWLRDAGYRVLEVSDGAAALRLLHGGGRVDILVTDVGLPGGMNGRQVANAARAERPDLPVLFITGYAGTALRTTLPKDMAVIDKPFALDELVTRIRTILESRHSNN